MNLGEDAQENPEKERVRNEAIRQLRMHGRVY